MSPMGSLRTVHHPGIRRPAVGSTAISSALSWRATAGRLVSRSSRAMAAIRRSPVAVSARRSVAEKTTGPRMPQHPGPVKVKGRSRGLVQHRLLVRVHLLELCEERILALLGVRIGLDAVRRTGGRALGLSEET